MTGVQTCALPILTPDELKSIPKGEFVVMKTGTHPMKTRLRLFLDWGITFGEPYQTPEHRQRKVYYAGRQELEQAIQNRFLLAPPEEEKDRASRERRSGQKNDRYDRQEKPAGQPLATIPDNMKKQNGPPPGEGE